MFVLKLASDIAAEILLLWLNELSLSHVDIALVNKSLRIALQDVLRSSRISFNITSSKAQSLGMIRWLASRRLQPSKITLGAYLSLDSMKLLRLELVKTIVIDLGKRCTVSETILKIGIPSDIWDSTNISSIQIDGDGIVDQTGIAQLLKIFPKISNFTVLSGYSVELGTFKEYPSICSLTLKAHEVTNLNYLFQCVHLRYIDVSWLPGEQTVSFVLKTIDSLKDIEVIVIREKFQVNLVEKFMLMTFLNATEVVQLLTHFPDSWKFKRITLDRFYSIDHDMFHWIEATQHDALEALHVYHVGFLNTPGLRAVIQQCVHLTELSVENCMESTLGSELLEIINAAPCAGNMKRLSFLQTTALCPEASALRASFSNYSDKMLDLHLKFNVAGIKHANAPNSEVCVLLLGQFPRLRSMMYQDVKIYDRYARQLHLTAIAAVSKELLAAMVIVRDALPIASIIVEHCAAEAVIAMLNVFKSGIQALDVRRLEFGAVTSAEFLRWLYDAVVKHKLTRLAHSGHCDMPWINNVLSSCSSLRYLKDACVVCDMRQAMYEIHRWKAFHGASFYLPRGIEVLKLENCVFRDAASSSAGVAVAGKSDPGRWSSAAAASRSPSKQPIAGGGRGLSRSSSASKVKPGALAVPVAAAGRTSPVPSSSTATESASSVVGKYLLSQYSTLQSLIVLNCRGAERAVWDVVRACSTLISITLDCGEFITDSTIALICKHQHRTLQRISVIDKTVSNKITAKCLIQLIMTCSCLSSCRVSVNGLGPDHFRAVERDGLRLFVEDKRYISKNRK